MESCIFDNFQFFFKEKELELNITSSMLQLYNIDILWSFLYHYIVRI